MVKFSFIISRTRTKYKIPRDHIQMENPYKLKWTINSFGQISGKNYPESFFDGTYKSFCDVYAQDSLFQRERRDFFPGDSSEKRNIGLGSYEDDHGIGMVTEFFEPSFQVLERCAIRNVLHNQSHYGFVVVTFCERSTCMHKRKEETPLYIVRKTNNACKTNHSVRNLSFGFWFIYITIRLEFF